MSFFEFPHTRTYDTDLGWIIKHLGELIAETNTLQAWAAEHKEEYEELAEKVEGLINNLVDVIVPWDSSVAYHIFSIVEYQGTNYIAVQDVPVGTMITNTEYWQPANTVVEQINAIGTQVNNIEDSVTDVNERVTEAEEKYNKEIIIRQFPGSSLRTFNTNYGKVWAIKIPKNNSTGVSNIPKIYGETNRLYTLKELSEKTGSPLLLNAGFFNPSTGASTQTLISNGTIVSDISSDRNILAIGDDGSLHQFPATTPASTILENGYNNACSCWGRIITNGNVDNTTITGMSSAVQNDTSQQNFGIDSNGDYWIITTSYTFNRNVTEVATWILDNIPDIMEVYSMDGGGSVGTIADGIMINDVTDTMTSEGRRINSCIYFDPLNTDIGSDDVQKALGEYAGEIKNYMAPARLQTIQAQDSPVAGCRINGLVCTQIGQIVIILGTIRVNANYPGGWQIITDAIFPPIDTSKYTPDLFSAVAHNTTDGIARSARVEVENFGSIQKGRAARLALNTVKPEESAGNVDFDINIVYVTQEAKTI